MIDLRVKFNSLQGVFTWPNCWLPPVLIRICTHSQPNGIITFLKSWTHWTGLLLRAVFYRRDWKLKPIVLIHVRNPLNLTFFLSFSLLCFLLFHTISFFSLSFDKRKYTKATYWYGQPMNFKKFRWFWIVKLIETIKGQHWVSLFRQLNLWHGPVQ